ncbi:hypothetical protein, partial [Chamaesiphon sp. OTE_20_metabat_361]|uniref:hypothetical protein n=1 Tax=Chamaesiphon sp. OTE_20_metabat_361 TaxID=2964689 RepID=UPI00286CD2CF
SPEKYSAFQPKGCSINLNSSTDIGMCLLFMAWITDRPIEHYYYFVGRMAIYQALGRSEACASSNDDRRRATRKLRDGDLSANYRSTCSLNLISCYFI